MRQQGAAHNNGRPGSEFSKAAELTLTRSIVDEINAAPLPDHSIPKEPSMKPVAMHFAAMAASALLALSAAAGRRPRSRPRPARRIANELAPSAPRRHTDPRSRRARIAGRAAAATGNVDAMNDLGVLYSIGGAVPLDYSKALYW